jgi:hypothetical protein
MPVINYYVVMFQSTQRGSALDMGHVSPHMIFANYREIVTPVVPISQAAAALSISFLSWRPVLEELGTQ